MIFVWNRFIFFQRSLSLTTTAPCNLPSKDGQKWLIGRVWVCVCECECGENVKSSHQSAAIARMQTPAGECVCFYELLWPGSSLFSSLPPLLLSFQMDFWIIYIFHFHRSLFVHASLQKAVHLCFKHPPLCCLFFIITSWPMHAHSL